MQCHMLTVQYNIRSDSRSLTTTPDRRGVGAAPDIAAGVMHNLPFTAINEYIPAGSAKQLQYEKRREGLQHGGMPAEGRA